MASVSRTRIYYDPATMTECGSEDENAVEIEDAREIHFLKENEEAGSKKRESRVQKMRKNAQRKGGEILARTRDGNRNARVFAVTDEYGSPKHRLLSELFPIQGRGPKSEDTDDLFEDWDSDE